MKNGFLLTRNISYVAINLRYEFCHTLDKNHLLNYSPSIRICHTMNAEHLLTPMMMILRFAPIIIGTRIGGTNETRFAAH